jgi:hypothetical protein
VHFQRSHRGGRYFLALPRLLIKQRLGVQSGGQPLFGSNFSSAFEHDKTSTHFRTLLASYQRVLDFPAERNPNMTGICSVMLDFPFGRIAL